MEEKSKYERCYRLIIGGHTYDLSSMDEAIKKLKLEWNKKNCGYASIREIAFIKNE